MKESISAGRAETVMAGNSSRSCCLWAVRRFIRPVGKPTAATWRALHCAGPVLRKWFLTPPTFIRAPPLRGKKKTTAKWKREAPFQQSRIERNFAWEWFYCWVEMSSQQNIGLGTFQLTAIYSADDYSESFRLARISQTMEELGHRKNLK